LIVLAASVFILIPPNYVKKTRPQRDGFQAGRSNHEMNVSYIILFK
jgi:hypothetical protein